MHPRAMDWVDSVWAEPESKVHETSEPGRTELWEFGRAITGFDDGALCDMLANFNGAEAATMFAVKEALNRMEPRTAANVLRNFLGFLRDDVGIAPLDAPVTSEPTKKRQRTTDELPEAGLSSNLVSQ